MDDWQLLRDYATRNSEEAFRALVDRYAGLVYHAALRQAGNPHTAEEVTQAVFIALAQKADRIPRGAILSGWLFRATRFACNNLAREQIRRQRREQEAVMMETILRPDETASVWEQIVPHLNDALDRLPRKDREAVLVRFFQDKSHRELARTLGVSEDAAKVRVSRALEKLRLIFARQGFAVPSAVLLATISAHGAQAAPAGLTASVASVAVAKGTAGTASTLTIAKGVLKLMAWTKAKTAFVVGASVLLAAGTTTVVIHGMHTGRQPVPQFQTLTLKVDSDLFIKNLMAEMGSTMNIRSNDWGDILLDLLRIQGVSCLPPCGIAFNTKTGEITTQNTPDTLDKFRQTVEELNQPDGRCDLVSRIPVKQEMLFTARFYKLSFSDFGKLGLGQPNAKATRNQSGWWMINPKSLNKLKQNLRSHGFQSFREARIDTGYGIAADLYAGTSDQNIGLECLPMSLVDNPSGKEQMIDLKVQASTTGYFTSNPAGDWPDYAGRTNCALFAEANVENGGALVFCIQNPPDSANHDLMVVLEATIKSTK